MTDEASAGTPGPRDPDSRRAAGPTPAPADLVRPAEARILAVDDERANLDLLRRFLEPVGYENLVTLADPRDVLPACRDAEPDLVILDVMMPHLDGFELYRRLADELPGFAYVPVLFLTADRSRQMQEKAFALGGQDFLAKPLSPREVRLRVRNLLTTRALHRELRQMNRELDARVRRRTSELEAARVEILERLALAAEYRDDQTGKHTQRVGRIAADIARELDLDDRAVEQILLAAPLHDVGKIGIHDSILLKDGGLTDGEYDRMATHTLIGADILGGSGIPLLEKAAEIARHHHERWDGSGYPDGLAGEEIPLPARIVAVADVFDSLTHDRSYKEAWDEDAALAYLEARRGEEFDPRVVDALIRVTGWAASAGADAGPDGAGLPSRPGDGARARASSGTVAAREGRPGSGGPGDGAGDSPLRASADRAPGGGAD